MKFLVSHGEKLFFLIVLGVGGWSLYGSTQSFRRGTVLPPQAKRLFGEIEEAFEKNTAPELPELKYASHLKVTLKSGTSESGPRLMPWITRERPREGGPEYVTGVLGVPRDVKTVVERGSGVTVSWSEPRTEFVNVVGYDVFAWLDGELPPDKPTFDEVSGTSVVHGQVEAEKAYRYKVRAIGVAAPKKDNQIVERPAGVTEAVDGGQKRWVTEFSKEVSAAMPSNIDFVYLSSRVEWGELFARIKIKVWNAQKGDWDIYETDPGIKKGERIKGYRVEGFRRIEYDSGYIFEKVEKETVRIPGPPRRVYNPETGRFENQETWIEKEIEYIIVRKDGTDETRRICKKSDIPTLEKAGKRPSAREPTSAARPPPRRPKKEVAGEVDFEALRAGMTAAGETKPSATGAAGAPAAPRRAASGLVPYEADGQTVHFSVPPSWTQVPGAFNYGDDANSTLMDGFVVAYAGPDEDLKMIVQQVYEDEGPFGAGTEEVVRACAEAWKRRTLAAFPEAKLEADVAVMAGLDGCLLAYFTVTTKVANKHLTVVRYSGYTDRMRYMATFVCRSEDYEDLSRTFLKVAATLVLFQSS